MIWGLALEPEKLYTTTFTEVVHLSLATLESRHNIGGQANPYCHVILKTNQCEQLLCTLVHGLLFQHSLDLKLMPKEKVTFSVQGPSVVYITGYSSSIPDDDMTDNLPFDLRSRNNTIEDNGHPPHGKSADEGSDDDDPSHSDVDASFQGQDSHPGVARGGQVTEEEEDEDDMETSGSMQVSNESVTGIPPASVPAAPGSEEAKNLKEAEVLISNLKEEQEVIKHQQAEALKIDQTSDSDIPKNEILPDPVLPTENPDQDFSEAQDIQERNFGKSLESQKLGSPSKSTSSQRGRNRRKPGNIDVISEINESVKVLCEDSRIMTRRRAKRQPSLEKPYTCSICGKKFTSKAYVETHKRIHTGAKPFKCSHCTRTFNRKENRKRHEQRHTCNFCGEVVEDELPSPNHKCLRDVSYMCEFCGKNFKLPSQLAIHERVHSGEKPFQCSFCTKTFSRKENCKRHEILHTSEWPYHCIVCSKGFSEKLKCLKHQQKHNEQEKWKCQICNKSFSRESNFKKHEVKHMMDNPFISAFIDKDIVPGEVQIVIQE